MPNDMLQRYNSAVGGGSRFVGETGGEVAAFEPLNIYDSPGVALGQLIGGVPSWKGLVNAVFNQENLSIEERTSLKQRLFGNVKNPVAATLAGLVTNPWVWTMFLTSPIGGKALRAGGSIFATHKGFMTWAQKSLPFLHQMLSPLENFEGVSGTMLHIHKLQETEAGIIKGMTTESEKALRVAMETHFEAQHGRKAQWSGSQWMDPSTYSGASDEGRMVRQVNLAKAGIAAGFTTGRTTPVPGRKYDTFVREGNGEWKRMEAPDVLKEIDPVAVQNTYMSQLEQVRIDRESKARQRWFGEEKAGGPSWREKDRMKQEAELALLKDPSLRPNRYLGATSDKDADATAFYEWWKKQDDFFEWRSESKKVASDSSVTPRLMDQGMIAVIQPYEKELMAQLAAEDKASKWALVRAIGDEKHWAETGGFKVDEDKMYKAVSSMNREVSSHINPGATTLQGKDMLVHMLGMDRIKMMRTNRDLSVQAKMMREAITDAIAEGVEGSWNIGGFVSRNNYKAMKNPLTGNRFPVSLDQVERSMVDLAPHAAMASMTEKISPLSSKEVLLHDDFLDAIEEFGFAENQDTLQAIKQQREKNAAVAGKVARTGEGVLMGWDPSNHTESMDRHFRNMNQFYAFDTAPISAVALAEDKVRVRNLDPEYRFRKTNHGAQGSYRVSWDLDKYDPKHTELFSHGDVLDRAYMSMSPAHQDLFREIAVPNAIGNAGSEMVAVYNSHIQSKATAGWFANSMLGKAIEKYGGKHGKGFIENMREMGNFNSDRKIGSPFDGMAKYLYATHLGLNVSSMLMNMTQPLLLAGTVANPGTVLKAYGTAAGEMLTYAKKRAALGMRFITPDEKLKLVRESFKHAEHIGIGPDIFQAMDSHLAAMGTSKWDRAQELMLKGFEKTEWFNRSVASHILEGAYKAAGRTAKDAHFATDLQRFVLQTQFGQNDLNTPIMFQRGILNNRLLRQFFTFPLRSLTGAAWVFPRMNEDGNAWKGAANVFFRGMGMGAIAYEVGKGMLGADLSRGLFAGSLTGLLGGDRVLDKDTPSAIPLPPVAQIPMDFIKGMAGDDSRLMMSAVARLVPGGVAINRAMGALPEMPRSGVGGFPGSLQQQFVGWHEMGPDGLVPVYRGDGALIEYKSPASIVAKAIGADLGQWKEQGELDGWLVKQKPQIDGMRHEFMRAMGANEFGRAAKIRAEFEKRFKVPLTVSNAQAMAYARSRVTSRTERVLNALPGDVRGAYGQAVAGAGGVPALDPSTLMAGGSAASRDALRPGGEEALREIARRVQQVGPAATQSTGSFEGFGGFRQ